MYAKKTFRQTMANFLRDPRCRTMGVFLGGVMMGVTAAPFGAWFFAWFALIPLWLTIHTAENVVSNIPTPKDFPGSLKVLFKTYRKPLMDSVIWGFVYQGMTLFWITGIHPMTWMGVPWFWSLCIAIICWLIITLWGMGIPLLWTVGMLFFYKISPPLKSSWQYRLSRIIYGAALWCVIEYLWSQGDLFWHFLAFSQSPYNLAILQLVRFSGFSLVTALLVVVNGCFSEWLMDNWDGGDRPLTTDRIEGLTGDYLPPSPRVKPRLEARKIIHLKNINFHFLGLGIVLCLGAHILGFWVFHQVYENLKFTEGQGAKIGIIQGNIPNTIKLYEDGTTRAIANYTRGYKTLSDQDVDLIVTPETALPFKIEQIIAWTEFYREILQHKIPVILGAFGTEAKNFTNSLFVMGSQGEVVSRYNKQQLVPLGEYIPFEAVLGKFIDRLSPLDTRLVRGVNPPTVNTPLGRATLAICYESAYPEHFRRQTAAGGEFIVVASNDAHYSATMPAQHHALDVMQAIANDRWTVRASNTGYSAIIAPTGKTQWISPLNEYAIHADTIHTRTTKTPYVRYGDWLIPINCLMIVLLSIYWKTR